MNPTRVATLLIIALVAAIAVYWTTSGRREPDGPTPESSKNLPIPASANPARTPRPRPLTESPGQTAPVLRAQQSYDAARNLTALVQSAQLGADAGSPEALRVIALASDECFVVQATPDRAQNFRDKFAASLTEPQRSVALRHNDIEEQRCRDLVAQGKLTPAHVRETLERAAAAGDVLASAMKLEEQSSEKSEDELKRGLRMIVASRDGEAIGVMAAMLGPREEEPQISGPFAGAQEDYIAWLLVACDLGRDCGENSRMVRQLCLVMGRCKPGGYQEFVRASLATPSQFDSATVKRKTLLQLILEGRYQEIFP